MRRSAAQARLRMSFCMVFTWFFQYYQKTMKIYYRARQISRNLNFRGPLKNTVNTTSNSPSRISPDAPGGPRERPSLQTSAPMQARRLPAKSPQNAQEDVCKLQNWPPRQTQRPRLKAACARGGLSPRRDACFRGRHAWRAGESTFGPLGTIRKVIKILQIEKL